MNLFLISCKGCDRETLAELRRLSPLLPVLGSGEPCVLTGCHKEQLALATEAQTVLGGAEVLPTHLCAAEDGIGFSEICLRAELLLERIRKGSLANRETLLLLAPTETLRGILQAAFHMSIEDARGIPVSSNSTRWIVLEGEHFFDLGALTDPETGSDTDVLPAGDSAETASGGKEQEKEAEQEVPEHGFIQTYFTSHRYREDAVTFVRTVNETIKTVQTVIEKRTEWSYGMQRPPDFARENDLRMLRTLMEGAIALACARALLNAEWQIGKAPPEREQPTHEENNYGVELDQSREQNGKTHGNEMQNSK